MNLTLPLSLITLILFNFFFNSFCAQDGKYNACSKRIRCGELSDISYPFYDDITRPEYCGKPGFKLDCHHDGPQLNISSLNYFLLTINGNTSTVARTDTWSKSCPSKLVNSTIDPSLYELTSLDQNITFFYGCLQPVSNVSVSCGLRYGGSVVGFYMTRKMQNESDIDLWGVCDGGLNLPILESCEAMVENSNNDPGFGIMDGVFQQGFEVGMKAEFDLCNECFESGGQCGYNSSSTKFVCYCTDGNYDSKCGVIHSISYKGVKPRTTLVIGLSTGFVVLLAIIGGCFIIIQKSKRNSQSQSVEDSLKNASLVPKRYAYKYIKKVTNSFREKLGEGGYGTVFKGSLKDGHFVAVKVWKQLKGDGQDFLNEVMSISRTSHINVVPLLGFCFEGHKRALIYEFMPNGSLDKFINGHHFIENNQPLSMQKLFEIGVGIARGLEYLHRGCNTRIVHFDIKPHNILLDAEFIPKISDFGLAKSCQQKETLISMSEARGTIGYIAPEVFFRTYGGVSHKSDVYSFGMMILEMVGCKSKVHENAENSSEMYFSQWIYKQLEQGTISINCERILNEEEKALERKMILVGLWCIQTNPVIRPSMSKVVEMLEGEVSLDVPPMPTLCTPPRQQLTDNESASFLSSTTYALTL